MNKPQDFDTAQGYGENDLPPAGGYVCKIMNIAETTSRKGDEMIIISLDIAEGEYANYFANSYKSDNRPDKKWGCNMYQLVYDPVNKNNTNKSFKTFITAVCDSNPNFNIAWGNAFCNCFKDKLVGCVFRREEYRGTDGNKHFYPKPYQFRRINAIRDGKFKIPEDKLLEDSPQSPGYASGYAPQSQPQNSYSAPDLSDFTEVVSSDDLPF